MESNSLCFVSGMFIPLPRSSGHGSACNSHPANKIMMNSASTATHRIMRFRPCIDLHDGKVKQIVGGSLRDDKSQIETNFETELPPSHFAKMYKEDKLPGGHVIMLGKGNEEAAINALSAFRNGMHVGGGINPENAEKYLNAGASHVIVTSYVFSNGQLDQQRLDEIVRAVGKERLVLDLSCKKKLRGQDDSSSTAVFDYYVCTDRWQKWTDFKLNKETLIELGQYCDEFLIHAVDVEGKRMGIDETLIKLLSESPNPVTYAGGARSLEDLELTRKLSSSKVDLTIGSALDIFGGSMSYKQAVKWQREQESTPM